MMTAARPLLSDREPALLALTVDRVASAERGKAMATFYTAWEFGISLGSSGAGFVLQRTTFSLMLLGSVIIPALGTVLALRVRTSAQSAVT